MAVKIRCSECRKKISVDEAFAGSMCRCPYCKSIVIVPHEAIAALAGGKGGRPARPARPTAPPTARPKAPASKRPRGRSGSGLINVVGSRPIISGEARHPQRPISGHKSAPAERSAGAELKSVEKPKPTPSKPTPVPVPPPAKTPPPTKAPSSPPTAETPGPVEVAPVVPTPAEPTPPPVTPVASTPEAPKAVAPAKPAVSEDAPAKKQPIAAKAAPGVEEPVENEEDEVYETAPVDESQLTDEQLAAIPMADPVVMQGMVTLLLIGVLVVMTAASVYLGIKVFGANDDDENPYGDGPEVVSPAPAPSSLMANPFLSTADGAIAEVKVAGPVVYVLDAGRRMGDWYAYARSIARASIRTLPAADRFGVLVAQDPQIVLVGGKMHAGGASGDAAVATPMGDVTVEGGTVAIGGAPQIDLAIDEALKQKPKTLVLIVSRKDILDPEVQGKKLADAGVRLVALSLGVDDDVQREALEKLVAATKNGSALRIYNDARQLREFYAETNVPE